MRGKFELAERYQRSKIIFQDNHNWCKEKRLYRNRDEKLKFQDAILLQACALYEYKTQTHRYAYSDI